MGIDGDGRDGYVALARNVPTIQQKPYKNSQYIIGLSLPLAALGRGYQRTVLRFGLPGKTRSARGGDFVFRRQPYREA